MKAFPDIEALKLMTEKNQESHVMLPVINTDFSFSTVLASSPSASSSRASPPRLWLSIPKRMNTTRSKHIRPEILWFWRALAHLKAARMQHHYPFIVSHEFLASLAFLMQLAGLSLNLSLKRFYPVDPLNRRPLETLQLTGRIDAFLQVGFSVGVIIPCLLFNPKNRIVHLHYLMAGSTSSDENSNHEDSLISDPALKDFSNGQHESQVWMRVLTFLIQDVGTSALPSLALTEYLSLSSSLTSDDKEVELLSLPRTLDIPRIKHLYPMMSPLLPLLIQVHEHLMMLINDGDETERDDRHFQEQVQHVL